MNLKFLLRPAARMTYDALEDPSAWMLDRHYITHKRTGTKLWTANGVFSLNPYDPEYDLFSLKEKFILWRKVRRVRAWCEAGSFMTRLSGLEGETENA